MTLDARVDRLEDVLARFIERTDQAFEEMRADRARMESMVLELRSDAARTNLMLLDMQRRADQDRSEFNRRFEGMQHRANEESDKFNKRFEESQRQFNERMDEANRRADEDRQAFNNRFEETQRQFNERMDEANRRADQERKDFNKRMAELSDSMGTLVEDMVVPNARRIAEQIFGDDPVMDIAPRRQRKHPHDPSRMIEVDLLVVGNRHLLVIEAKRKITPEKIREFLDRCREVLEFFPEYANHKLVPAIASVTMTEEVIKFLNRQKVYGIAMGDDTMQLVNLGQF